MHTIEQVLDLGRLRAEIADLEQQVAVPDLWDDQANAQRVTGRMSALRGELDRFTELQARLDDLQAAFLTVKLPDLAAANDRRRSLARRYLAALSGLPDMACPAVGDDGMVWHQFVVRSPERDSLRSRLALAGVGTDIHYPTAPFDQPCYAGHYDRVRFPVAAELASQVLSLPMSDYLSEAEVCHVIQATTEVTRHARAAA